MLNKVKELRVERGWTLEKLADLAELSISTVSDIENFHQYPTHLSMLKLGKAFDLYIHHIFEYNHKNVF